MPAASQCWLIGVTPSTDSGYSVNDGPPAHLTVAIGVPNTGHVVHGRSTRVPPGFPPFRALDVKPSANLWHGLKGEIATNHTCPALEKLAMCAGTRAAPIPPSSTDSLTQSVGLSFEHEGFILDAPEPERQDAAEQCDECDQEGGHQIPELAVACRRSSQ